MKLEEKMAKYPTVRHQHCNGCGNPWYFKKEKTYECTTCLTEWDRAKLDNGVQEKVVSD